MKFILTLILVLSVLFTTAQNYRTITKEELTGKIAGYWIGQLAGNYIGFPFENLYTETPVPVFVDRYFDYRDADSLGLKMNLNDRRGYVRIMAHAMGGAWSDDDTDIEFVMLHGLEKYGLDINYDEVAELRKKHINRFIWASNAKVKDLLHQGYIPPKTGSKELNENWYRITSQLINEIWGVVYPGMTNKAAEWGEWGAKITGDDWGTHGAVIYAAMYSAAFFENDVNELVQIGISKIPDDSPFKKAVNDLIGWHRENPDWRETRRLIHENYYKEIDGFRIPDPVAGAVVNGLSAIMALLYGEGDFTKTVGIAVTAGYDCDNQAATVGGLLGVMNGAKSIPGKFTKELPARGKWDEPFNDTYINYSRDHLPGYNKISDIVNRLVKLTETAILEGEGAISNKGGQTVYSIKTDF
ncbi:MAG: ADP-ribosylglycohydrolase family protein [Prolixibacteraceae bacterium]